MPSIPAVMMHGIIKIRVERFNNSMKACASLAEQIDAYRRDLEIDAGSLVINDYHTKHIILTNRPTT